MNLGASATARTTSCTDARTAGGRLLAIVRLFAFTLATGFLRLILRQADVGIALLSLFLGFLRLLRSLRIFRFLFPVGRCFLLGQAAAIRCLRILERLVDAVNQFANGFAVII